MGIGKSRYALPCRGKKVLRSEASVLKDFRGQVIHDFLPAYFKLEQRQHGICQAHVLRELQGLVENGSA